MMGRETADSSMAESPDASIVGTMIAGCFLQVQYDLWKMRSRYSLFRRGLCPNQATAPVGDAGGPERPAKGNSR